MSKDYYNILGVSKSATQQEIKKAFRKKAHEYHPDKKTGDEAKFKEINEAYQVLGNETKRKQYDQFGTAFNGATGNSGRGGQGGFSDAGFNWQDFARQAGSQSGFGGYRTNVNFEDFDLGDIFGDFFGGRSQSRTRSNQSGSDLEYQLDISLRESAFGAEKKINIKKLETCPNCSGKGYESSAKIITCPQCNGRGRIISSQRTIFGSFQTETICPTCQGQGKKPDKFCPKCHGQGRVETAKQLDIKIPAGINNGESIKISGQGEAGIKGASSGDLFITFRIKPDPKFRRKGYDIISQQEINIAQAALGDKIKVETLDGYGTLKIPSGTESGKVFKISGKGTEKLHGRGRGDHLVEIIVKTPKSLSRKAKRLLEQLKQEI